MTISERVSEVSHELESVLSKTTSIESFIFEMEDELHRALFIDVVK